MKNKSVLEQALLEAQQLEEAVKSNAKEILASTMKQEIEDLVKESLNEQEGELDFGEVEQEDLEDEVSGLPNEEEAMVSIEVDADEPLDLTGASDSEVLKVFKAMGAEDGIVVTQDDDVVELEDQEAGTEYKIELAENKLKNYPFINERMGDLNEEEIMVDLEDEEIQPESESALEEALYEIELEETDEGGGPNKGAKYFDEGGHRFTKGPYGKKERETFEADQGGGPNKGAKYFDKGGKRFTKGPYGKKGNHFAESIDFEDEDLSEQFTDNNSIFNSLQDYQNWCKTEGSEGCDENDYKWNAYLAYRQMGPPASTEVEPFIKNLIGGDLAAFEAAYDGDVENPLEKVASKEQQHESRRRVSRNRRIHESRTSNKRNIVKLKEADLYNIIDKVIAEKRNGKSHNINEYWMQNVSKEIKKDHTGGTFRHWCERHGFDSGCSDECIHEALKTDDTLLHYRAGLAKAFCGADHHRNESRRPRRTLQEKWKGDVKIKKLDKWGEAEISYTKLCAKGKALSCKDDKTSKESTELKQIQFALRSREKGKAFKGVPKKCKCDK